MEFLFVILRFLFPLDPVRQVWFAVHEWLLTIFDAVETDIERLRANPQTRINLERVLIALEETLRALIEARARQIAGVRGYMPRPPSHFIPSRARSLDDLLVRLANVACLYNDIERLAQRRAERLRRELERNPLGLSETVVDQFARVLSTLTMSSTGEAGGGGREADGGGWLRSSRIAQRVRAPP